MSDGPGAKGRVGAGVRRVALLGSTGSIGTQTLELIARNRDRFDVVALAARSNVELLAAQAREFGVEMLAVAGGEDDQASAAKLESLLVAEGLRADIATGQAGLEAIARSGQVDTVLNAVVGAAGLRSTLATLEEGKRLALANKESLVAGGDLVRQALEAGGGELLPVDSEHAALAQCLRAGSLAEVRRMVITASGGPFRGYSAAQLRDVGVSDALRHPTWQMGAKITIDSATLMNKGLETIEAHVLFDIDYDSIEVVVHPQSVVHAMVEFVDGSTLAQLALPNMEGPIGFALGAPDRINDPVGTIDWSQSRELTFEEPDTKTFRCLEIATSAGRAGGVMPAVMNAANEEAVAAFLGGQIRFTDIPDAIERALELFDAVALGSAEELFAVEEEARLRARAVIADLGKT